MRRPLVQLLAACVVALFAAAPVQADTTARADLASMHRLALTLEGDITASQAAAWRAALDGDASGTVSAQELSIGVDAFEFLVTSPGASSVDVFYKIMDLENATGAEFTDNGRSNLTAFVISQASGFGTDARLDSVNGTLERVAITFERLSGPVSANASFSTREEVVFTWSGAPSTGEQHTVEMAVPALANVSVALAGAFQIVTWVGINEAVHDAGLTSVSGTAAGSLVTVVFRERPTAMAAQLVVLGAVVVAAGAASFAALVLARKQEVREKPLPVLPKYK